MPRFLDGYQTTLGSRMPTNKISDALNVALIKEDLIRSSLDVKKKDSVSPVFLTGLGESEETIPLFSHPYYVLTRHGVKLLVTDMRLCINKQVYDGSLPSLKMAISRPVEYAFSRTRSILNLEWIAGDVESMKTNLYFATMMFGRWVSDALFKAYALDARDQQIIAIVCAYYYQALFSDAIEHDEETLQKWGIHTIKVTHADSAVVQEIFKKMPVMKDLSSLCEGIRLSTENVRLRDLNQLSLLNLLKNTFYGDNAKEIIAIATEHPPTWMTIVYAALSQRTYRTSTVYKIAERVGKRGIDDEYIKAVNGIISENTLTNGHVALASAGLI